MRKKILLDSPSTNNKGHSFGRSRLF